MHQNQKDKLTKAIVSNSRNKFTEEDLRSRSLDELENLASLAGVEADYSGKGGPRTNQEDKTIIPAPIKVWPAKTAA